MMSKHTLMSPLKTFASTEPSTVLVSTATIIFPIYIGSREGLRVRERCDEDLPYCCRAGRHLLRGDVRDHAVTSHV